MARAAVEVAAWAAAPAAGRCHRVPAPSCLPCTHQQQRAVQRPQRRHRRRPLAVPPAVFATEFGGAAEELLAPLQALIAGAGAAVLAAWWWDTRPRGWAATDLIEVRPSALHGLGVFARTHIPAGVELGSYPGRPRLPLEMMAKCQQAPQAAQYALQVPDWRGGGYLDPTDSAGSPSGRPGPGFPWFVAVDIALTRVNEPLPGGSTNTEVVDGRGAADMLFVATRDIAAGEELFLDYGVDYNRSKYQE